MKASVAALLVAGILLSSVGCDLVPSLTTPAQSGFDQCNTSVSGFYYCNSFSVPQTS